MTNPPDRPRDDRRMHEGRGETATLDRDNHSVSDKPNKDATSKK